MPRRVRRTTKRRPLKGKGIKDWLGKANHFLKKSKVISRTLGNIAGDVHRDGRQGLMWVKPIEMLAKSYGYGRKRSVRRTRAKRPLHGNGKFLDWIKNKALPWLKKTKIISTVGNALAPIPGIGTVAGAIGKVAGVAGYGRPRRRRRITAMKGSGYGGSNTFSAGAIGAGRKRKSHHGMRGRGRGHLNTPYAKVGIPGAATFSSGHVQF